MIDGIIGVQQKTLTMLVSTDVVPKPLLIFKPNECDLIAITINSEKRMPIAKAKNIWIGVMNFTAGKKNTPNGSIGSKIKYKAVRSTENITNTRRYLLELNVSWIAFMDTEMLILDPESSIVPVKIKMVYNKVSKEKLT
jgi:hypothetical protein